MTTTLHLTIVLASILAAACSNTVLPTSPTSSVTVATAADATPAAPSEAPETASPDNPNDEPTTPGYSCTARAAEVAQYIAARPHFDTVMIDLSSGERVYIDWERRVFHVSGPVCTPDA